MDRLTKDHRSKIISLMKVKNTAPESVRRTAHAMGFRYRLHRKDVSGRPDIGSRNTGRPYSSMDAFGIGTPTAGKRTRLNPTSIFSGRKN